MYTFQQGSVPLLVSMPHIGTVIPDALQQRMTPAALALADTDWHLNLLYNMLEELGASSIQARYSRYVIDLNRAADDANLYPGLDTTGLCPIDTFSKAPIYTAANAGAQVLDQAEITQRVQTYWLPYHQQIQQELQRMRAEHGIAILWDAHSIASQVPRFFSGRLPDLNFGTADQASCAPALQSVLLEVMQNNPLAAKYPHVFNGRFKGGYITRHYGQPQDGVHAIQLEMSQIVYMNENPPFDYRAELAQQIQPLLRALLLTCLQWAKQQAGAQT
jgi:N-formylglutamate deformylase